MDHGQAFTYGRQKQYGLNKNKTLITELQLCACTPDWICTKLKPDLSRRPVPFSFSFDPLRRIKHTASASAPYYERFQRSLWLKRAFRQKSVKCAGVLSMRVRTCVSFMHHSCMRDLLHRKESLFKDCPIENHRDQQIVQGYAFSFIFHANTIGMNKLFTYVKSYCSTFLE